MEKEEEKSIGTYLIISPLHSFHHNYNNNYSDFFFTKLDKHIILPVSRARSHPVPGVVAGSGTMQISNIMDVISIFIHITHECMDSKKLIMWSHTESDV